MRELIKQYLPAQLKRSIKGNISKFNILRDYYSDFNRFVKHSASVSTEKKESLESFLIKEYHAIEKGLALRVPRKGFGIIRIHSLLDSLDFYQATYGNDDTLKVTMSVLREYREYNKGFIDPAYDRLSERIEAKLLKFDGSQERSGGTKVITRASILSQLNFNFEGFLKSRYSIRDFTDEPVPSDLLIDAINMARYTPSACNRQAWRVTLIEHSNATLKAKLLDVQNGNGGFRDQINALLVITGKLSSFYDYERNQVFIDGGMFAMTLLLALHSKGLGKCCLNMSVNTKRGKDFLKALEIGEENVPIMYIAVGNLKEESKVAQSRRKDLDEIVSRPAV